MIDSEIVMGDRSEDHRLPRRRSPSRLALVARAVSTRTTVLVLGGIQLRAESGPLAARGDRHGALAAGLGRGAGRAARARSSFPGRLLLDIARSLPEAEVTIEHLPGRVDRARSPPARRTTGSTPTAPRTSHGCPTIETLAAPRRSTGDALIETSAASDEVASRDESRPGADRDPRALRAGEGRDGGDRLLPARRQGDARSRSPLPDLEAIIPARALQELSRIAGGADGDPARRATRTTSSSAPAAPG